MKEDFIELRRLNDDDYDYKLLEVWYKEKSVYSNFEQRIIDYNEIVKKYKPRTKIDAKIPVFMIKYDNMEIGIIQYQRVNERNLKLYNLTEKNAYEVDVFIGNTNFQGKGIGKKVINILCNYLLKNKKARKIVMCPLVNNINAIKCYEKCGFKKEMKITTEDTVGVKQEYYLMILNNLDK